MVATVIVIVVIALLVALALRYSVAHRNECSGCSGECGSCSTNKGVKEMYDEIKAAEAAKNNGKAADDNVNENLN